nr:hypothetical protein [uncultured Chitinophaga sp.]
MKYISLTLMIVLLGLASVQAQYRPSFPDENGLKVKEDYPPYEPTVIAAADWLVETDADQQTDVREATNRFIVRWVYGAPNVRLTFDKPHEKLMRNNLPLIPVYFANYASYCIRHQPCEDVMEPTKAALTAIAKVYKKGILVKKNKMLDKLVEAVEQNQLKAYIRQYPGLVPPGTLGIL